MPTFSSLFSDPVGSITSIGNKISQAKKEPMKTLFDTLAGTDRIEVEDIKQEFYREKSNKNGIAEQCLVYLEMPKGSQTFIRSTGGFNNLVQKGVNLLANSKNQELIAKLELPIYKRAKYKREVQMTEDPVAYNERITTFISAKKPVIRINGIVSNKTVLHRAIPTITIKPKPSILKNLGNLVLSNATSMGYTYARKEALQMVNRSQTLSSIKELGGKVLGVAQGVRGKINNLLGGQNDYGFKTENPLDKIAQNKMTDCQTFLGLYDACASQGYLFTIWYMGIKFEHFAITNLETNINSADMSSMEVDIEAKQIAMSKNQNNNSSDKSLVNAGMCQLNMCPINPSDLIFRRGL